ncbi:hypothetical protein IAE16_05875 [Hydrogenobacter sp. T-2]|uniref:hypothetical protein n=1 Tax=Pampinifervens diazotrophicum TaxID=1632018 RepID=UPI002B25DCB3|nr:hypothetical protein [Hydrogenobacter sp. T-2]WPM31350.1 hypothetical protein IAE16_05875 [Hydrogenobacter sp. T-2]
MREILKKLDLQLIAQEEGGWLVLSPDFPELITEIDELEELPEVLEDSLRAVLELYMELEKPLPEKFGDYLNGAEENYIAPFKP